MNIKIERTIENVSIENVDIIINPDKLKYIVHKKDLIKGNSTWYYTTLLVSDKKYINANKVVKSLIRSIKQILDDA